MSKKKFIFFRIITFILNRFKKFHSDYKNSMYYINTIEENKIQWKLKGIDVGKQNLLVWFPAIQHIINVDDQRLNDNVDILLQGLKKDIKKISLNEIIDCNLIEIVVPEVYYIKNKNQYININSLIEYDLQEGETQSFVVYYKLENNPVYTFFRLIFPMMIFVFLTVISIIKII